MAEPNVREFQIGRSKSQHGFVVGGFCLIVGLVMLLFVGQEVTQRYWIGALMLGLGLSISVHAWRTGRWHGAQLRLDAAGVYFREWGAGVPWSEIADVYQSGSRLQPFITLRVRDAGRFLAGLPRDEARRLGRNRLWKAPELRIPYSAVDASRDEILNAIKTGIEQSSSGLQDGQDRI